MEISTTPTIRREDRQTQRSLILGILVWFLHLNIVYGLASLACRWGWFPFTIAGIPGVKVMQALVTLVALALMIALVYLPYRQWRWYQPEKPTDNPNVLKETEEGRPPFMAFVIMLTNSFFLLFVIATFVPMVALHTCG